MYNSTILNKRISDIKGNRILVAPLNWGLGHATRCVPVIRQLLLTGKEVIIAADGYPLLFLQKEFPQLQTIDFRWTKIKYSSSNSQVMTIFWQIPKFICSIIKEHQVLKRIIKSHNIDAVISDNRFGLWHRCIKSIYITHQLYIKITLKDSFLNNIAYHIHKMIIEKYDECWVPDFEGKNNLSGDLSHKYPLPNNAYFIGILSRFS